MLIDTLLRECATSRSGATRLSDTRGFDLKAFARSEVEAVAIGLESATIILVVAADGSMQVIDNGHLCDDFDGLRLSCEDPAAALAALPDAQEFQIVHDLGDVILAAVGSFRGRPLLGAATAGLRRRLGLTSNATMSDLAATAQGRGLDPHKALAEIDAFSEALDEPFFHPADEISWTSEDSAWVEDMLVCILQTDPDYAGEEVQLLAASHDEHARLDIDYEPGSVTGQRAIAILSRLTELDDRFCGTAYEYNDGAASRRSGYCADSPVIFSGEIEPASAHERLAAHEKLRDALAARHVPAGEIARLLGARP